MLLDFLHLILKHPAKLRSFTLHFRNESLTNRNTVIPLSLMTNLEQLVNVLVPFPEVSPPLLQILPVIKPKNPDSSLALNAFLAIYHLWPDNELREFNVISWIGCNRIDDCRLFVSDITMLNIASILIHEREMVAFI